jgi:MoaA/NifB/PqqE/SkfB family radical SAM enzyme
LKGKRAQVLAHAKWVRISIDYTSARQMVDSRNVPERFYDDIINNIHTFAELKNSKCDLGINFIITKSNYNDIVPFAKMMKSAGVENIRFSPVYVNNFAAYHAPIADRVTEQLKQCQEFCDDSFSINTTYILMSLVQ